MALSAGFTAPMVMALNGWKTDDAEYAAVTDQTLRAAAEAVSGNQGWSGRRRAAALGSKPMSG